MRCFRRLKPALQALVLLIVSHQRKVCADSPICIGNPEEFPVGKAIEKYLFILLDISLSPEEYSFSNRYSS
jgi:hypothetical protein